MFFVFFVKFGHFLYFGHTIDENYPSLLDRNNAEFIEYADRISNGVNAYFTVPTRTTIITKTASKVY